MVHRHTPAYLATLVPPRTHETHNYHTRQTNNITQVKTKTNLYKNSFLPSAIRLWNDLPLSVQENPSLSHLKRTLNTNTSQVPLHFLIGNRIEQILHTRLRLNCSSLKSHLHARNIINNPNCACGNLETTHHILLECPLYNDACMRFLDPLPFPKTERILLFGSPTLNVADNIQIVKAVHRYIIASKRFS